MGWWGREHYSFDSEITVDLVFRCAHCSGTYPCKVIGLGSGYSRDWGWFDDGARERALDASGASAREEAREVLKLAACPGCGERDAQAHASFVRGSALAAAAWFVIPAIFGFVVPQLGLFGHSSRGFGRSFRGAGDTWLPLVGVAIGLIAAVAAAVRAWRTWNGRETRVAFAPTQRTSRAPRPRR